MKKEKDYMNIALENATQGLYYQYKINEMKKLEEERIRIRRIDRLIEFIKWTMVVIISTMICLAIFFP